MKKIYVAQYLQYGYGRQEFFDTEEESVKQIKEWDEKIKGGWASTEFRLPYYGDSDYTAYQSFCDEIQQDDWDREKVYEELLKRGIGEWKIRKAFNDEYASQDHSKELVVFSVEYDDELYEPINSDYDGMPCFNLIPKNEIAVIEKISGDGYISCKHTFKSKMLP